MADFTVTLPSLGDDAGTKAQVSFVYVKPGDKLKQDDDVVEMVTDKATFNVPCPREGRLVKMLVSEGDDVNVGDPICLLDI